MKNITVAIPDDVYRRASVRAAEQGRSVGAIVAEFLRTFAAQESKFAHLEALQRRVQEEIVQFRGTDRLDREQVHERALP